MTRIITGRHGGRRIKVPKGDGTRPTSDRVREAMFSSLESELGGFDGLHVLDLFAGSGALGLESLSRGAASAVFVESDRRAAAIIRDNVAALGATGARVLAATVERMLGDADATLFDLVFIDPPYALSTAKVAAIVSRLDEVTADDALVVVERSSRDPFTWPEGVEPLRDKAYGDTHLWYGR